MIFQACLDEFPIVDGFSAIEDLNILSFSGYDFLEFSIGLHEVICT